LRVFVDTSAFYASLTPEDPHHQKARRFLQRLDEIHADLVTTNYILLECASLIQKRQGFSQAKTFLHDTSNIFEIIWVDKQLHEDAFAAWSKAQHRGLSLVDCVSFAAMKLEGIHKALAFDSDFHQQGFEVMAL